MKNRSFQYGWVLIALLVNACNVDETTTSSYSYKLEENGCKTEKNFGSLAEFCSALEDWKINSGCA